MTSKKKAIILRRIYLTLKPKLIKNQNTSIWALLYAAHIDILQFIQKSVFDYNTCTANWVPLTGNCDNHLLIFLIWGWNHSGGSISLFLLVIVEVVLVLGPPTSTPKKNLAQTSMMIGFGHLRVIRYNFLWYDLGLGIIKSNLPIILHFVLHMVMIYVVFVLVPSTSDPIKLHHLWVGNSKSMLIVVFIRAKNSN